MNHRGDSMATSEGSVEARVVGALQVNGQKLMVFEESTTACEELPGELTRFSLNDTRYVIVSQPPRRDGADPVELLTARELQIATLVANGFINKEVASRLGISEWTVCTHLRRIYSKLRVSTRGAMVFRCADLVNAVGNR
jgi:DNA-binding CsgD family transcriptional regulator